MEFQLGKILVVMGVGIVALGLLLMFGARIPFLHFGRLPGDIALKGKHGSFYFPIVSCLVLSVLLTVILWIVSMLTKR